MDSIYMNSFHIVTSCTKQPHARAHHLLNRKNLPSSRALIFPSSFQSLIQRRGRRGKKLRRKRISSFAAVESSSGNGAATSRSLTGRSSSKALKISKSSSALEQLDIERGVCIPFRKYSPEIV